MKFLILGVVLVAMLSACATSKQLQGPSGRTAYFIKCGSAVIDKCYEEAAKVCPQGYVLADTQTNPNGVIAPAGNSLLFVRGPNSMLVECKS